MERYQNIIMGFSIVLVLLTMANVEASSIAVNPGSLRDDDMTRGGYAEKDVRVSTDEEEAVVNIAFNNRDNEMNDWVRIEPDDWEFEVGRSNPRDLKVIVEPPENVPNGDYNTSLVFMVRSNDEFTGVTGAVIDTAVSFRVNIEIVDNEVVDCRVLSENIGKIESGDDLVSNFKIQNLGNIRLNPSIDIEIWNQEQSTLEEVITYDEHTILPTISEEISIQESSRGMSPGQYFADIEIPECRYEKTVTFDILEPGTISSEGNLVGIRAPAWNNASEEIPINPVFENSGEKAHSAFFEGVVKLEGSIKGRLNTPEIIVQPDQRIEFETYFSSDEPGRYEVSGRVYYGNKRTFERVNRFNIMDQKPNEQRSSLGTSSGFILIFLASASLSLMIMIKKKRQKSKRK